MKDRLTDEQTHMVRAIFRDLADWGDRVTTGGEHYTTSEMLAVAGALEPEFQVGDIWLFGDEVFTVVAVSELDGVKIMFIKNSITACVHKLRKSIKRRRLFREGESA